MEEESGVYESTPGLGTTCVRRKHLPSEVPRGYRTPAGRREVGRSGAAASQLGEEAGSRTSERTVDEGARVSA